jgi:hypothetical protein
MSPGRIRSRPRLPSRRLARGSRGFVLGSLWLRVVTSWRAAALDRELAAGADPMESDELSLRVGRLGSARTRARLACSLRGAVELADRQWEPLSLPSAMIRRAEVRANRELLLELAERLRTTGPLGAGGLAMASVLIADRASPLYRESAARSLTVAAFEALVALERGHLTASTTDSRTRRTSPG